MMNTSFVEDLVAASLSGNNKEMVKILEKITKDAEKTGKANVAQRLKNIIRKIPSTRQFSGQGLYGAPKTEPAISLVHTLDSEVLLEEVVLENDLNAIISRMCLEWENLEALSRNNLKPLNKLLFYGQPGTGKTKLAYAIANKLDLPLVVVQLDEVISSFLGKTGKNIKEIFEIAERQSVVVFLDEIDTLAKHRDDEHELGELKRVVSVLIQNIDAFPSHSVLIGATNHEHLLDKALWRRFDEKVHFNLPDKVARKKLFHLFLQQRDEKLNIDLLASITDGMSGATINQICERAKKQSVLNKLALDNNVLAQQILIETKNHPLSSANPKQVLYATCRLLKNGGLSVKEIAHLSGIAYTTLRDNLR